MNVKLWCIILPLFLIIVVIMTRLMWKIFPVLSPKYQKKHVLSLKEYQKKVFPTALRVFTGTWLAIVSCFLSLGSVFYLGMLFSK